MELSDYLRLLRRNWIPASCCLLLSLLISGLLATFTAPMYSSKTQLFVAIQNSGSVQELQQGNTFSQARVKSYVETVGTPAVLQPAIDSMGLDITPAELANKVSATADLDTVIISISVLDDSPIQAAALASAISESLIATIETLESPAAGGISPVKLSVVTPATAPPFPSSPNTKLYLAIGLILGLGAALGFVALRSAFDTRIRSESDLRRISQAPLLGGLAFDPEASKAPLLTQVPPQSSRAETFRQIRTNLQFANVNSDSKSVLITSSLPGEGKSTTATNMAVAMSQAGQRVVLIDADLRRPMVAEYLGLERNAGLTTALIGAAEVRDLLQPWGQNGLNVLTSGQIPPNPSELLGSQAMADLLTELETIFDVIIIDAPPLIPVTDATVLAQKVGGVVVVVGTTKIRIQDLEKSLSSLSLVKANILGIVLNLLPAKGPDAYAQSYYSYETRPDTTHPGRHGNKSLNSGSMTVRTRANRVRTSTRDTVEERR
ncbi:polysaccharide biosynthesis tyrosine autokinase [Arthrobacter yangruifuii]|uniref:non-specific protein-tyrosine kinase n=1 Tax=Arthrobacter yangruifuii TaxID=2606616 RepID=A0A5N6MFL5_9MICC|nr:polysaccharide biosynthesis tyrosine autokinase [Arthrobacter yangruifuii]KAD3515256.1 polysaccharide biosynthesis tyrosine autokinase [Arthrobacter yangruifuii]